MSILSQSKCIAFAFIALHIANLHTFADTIPGLYTTGVDNSGAVIPRGLADPHYVVLENSGSNAEVLNEVQFSYIPNNSSSQWIWENADGLPVNVTRTFRTTFDLTGFDPETAEITGTWATDNRGVDILINGSSTGNTASRFDAFTSFSIDSGFQNGINTLDFVVADFGVVAAFRVDSISGTVSAVPEPSSIIIALGFGMIPFARRGRIK